MTMDPTAAATHPSKRSIWLDALIACFWFGSAMVCLQLVAFELFSRGAFDTINVLFDYDIAWYVDVIARAPNDWQTLEPDSRRTLWLKHPWIYNIYWLANPLRPLAASDAALASLATSVFSALTVAGIYALSRILGAARLPASMITAMYLLSATTLTNGGMPEAYGLAITPAVGLCICLALWCQHDIHSPLWLRALLGAIATGVTVIFVVLYVLIELAYEYKRDPRKPLFIFWRRQLWISGLAITACFAIGIAVTYLPYLAEVVSDPVGTAKKYVWAVHQAGEKQGLLQVLTVFLQFALVAPELSIINVNDEETIGDFRKPLTSAYAWFAWLVFMACAIWGTIKSPKEARPILTVAFAWIIFLVLFHLQYQYRGSLFLYTPHHWFMCFIPLALCAASLNSNRATTAVSVALGAALVAMVVNNSERLYEVIDFLDTTL